jgi:Leucine Rich Repeat (LRR) protein
MSLRIRYRLRTLLLAVAVLAVPLRWWGVHAAQDRALRERIAAIESRGGQVGFGASDAQPSFDKKLWLALGGDDRLGRPAIVLFVKREQLTDDTISQLDLVSFPALESVYLDEANIGDRTVGKLAALKDLKELSLADTHITDGALETIGRLTNLEVLDLKGTAVTDAGLMHLKLLAHLEMLDVCNTPVTREGIDKLRNALPATLINNNARRNKPQMTTLQSP